MDVIEKIAILCHEANRAYCAALGDMSQQKWPDAPEWQQISAIKGVEFIRDNPDASPSASHESWLAEKEAAGWRYGEIKDPDAKTHPCFVSYGLLPQEQRAKDYIFGAVARTSLALFNDTEIQDMPKTDKTVAEEVAALLNDPLGR